MQTLTYDRAIPVAVPNPVPTADLAEFMRCMQPFPGARILDIGGTPVFWSALDRQRHPLGITLVNLPGLLDLQYPADGFSVINGDVGAIRSLVVDRAIDIVVCRGVVEHLGEGPLLQTFVQDLQGLRCGYWVQTAGQSGWLHRLWSGHRDDSMPLADDRRPSWMESPRRDAIVDRHRLAALFPEADRVSIGSFWGETSYAAYRSC